MIVAINGEDAVRVRSLPVSRPVMPHRCAAHASSNRARRLATMQLGMPAMALVTRLSLATMQ